MDIQKAKTVIKNIEMIFFFVGGLYVSISVFIDIVINKQSISQSAINDIVYVLPVILITVRFLGAGSNLLIDQWEKKIQNRL